MASTVRILTFAWTSALTTACILGQDLGSTAVEKNEKPDSALASDAIATSSQDGAMGDARDGRDVSDALLDRAADAKPDVLFDCDKVLQVDQIQPTTCAFVDPVSHRVAHLRWACADGPARLVVDTFELDGTVKDGVVALSGCREDPSATLSGHYETVDINVDLGSMRGSLVYARASGLACPKVYTDCSATAGVTILP